MLRLAFIAAITSLLLSCADTYSSAQNPISEDDCTLTQGYWKNHPDQWPVGSVTLGTVTYSQAEALAILGQPVDGNGLVALAHQLLAAKLNVAAGSTSTVGTDIADADALIGGFVVPPVGTGYFATKTTSKLAQTIDDFNIGETGPGHCEGVGEPDCACGDGVVHAPETCDDGNTANGDGCSEICRWEPIL